MDSIVNVPEFSEDALVVILVVAYNSIRSDLGMSLGSGDTPGVKAVYIYSLGLNPAQV